MKKIKIFCDAGYRDIDKAADQLANEWIEKNKIEVSNFEFQVNFEEIRKGILNPITTVMVEYFEKVKETHK